MIPRNAITQPRRGIRGGGGVSSAGLDDVEDGEEEDPDDIYKMPIEANIIEGGGPSRPIVPCEKLTKKTPQDEENADKDMRSVKTCHYKKAGAVDPVFVKPKALVMQVIPLPCLHREEDGSGHDRGQKPDESGLALLFDGHFRAMEQETAADEDDRICDHHHVQTREGPLDSDIGRSGRRPRLAARQTKNDVRTDQTSKEHRLGGEKSDHAKAAHFRRRFGMPGMLAMGQNGRAHNFEFDGVEGDGLVVIECLTGSEVCLPASS